MRHLHSYGYPALVVAAGSVVATLVFSTMTVAGQRSNSRELKTVEFVRTASLAAEAFKQDHGHCPGRRQFVTTAELAGQLEPAYVATVPRFDTWGQPLRIWTDAESQCWVSSLGPDGRPGTDSQPGDDIRFRSGKRIIADDAGSDSRVRETSKALRTVSLSAEAYKLGSGICPAATGVVSAREIRHLVEPAFVASLPLHDAWGESIHYWTQDGQCCVASGGPNRLLETRDQESDDIVFVGGAPATSTD